MSCKKYKDPGAKLNYGFDWSEWLAESAPIPTGEIIASSTWSVPSGITEYTASLHSDTVTQVFLQGGTVGESYDLVNHIVTSPSGYEDERTLTIEMVDK